MKTNNQTKTLSLGSIFRKVGAVMMCAALLASTNLTLAAEANNLGGGGAYNDFREANPGIANKELRQMFKDQFNLGGGAGGGVISLPQPVITDIQSGPNNAINLNADNATKQELREAKQALRLQMQDVQRGFSNQTLQDTGAKLVNAGFGVSLDLNSAIENITLGNNLFKTTDSVVINVGGETKTLNAGSKVTAAEYVAAKQVLGAGSQTVNLDANGKAIGGAVDFASMGTKTFKVTDINIGENVTAYGDFGKGGDVKISGDFTNSGSVVAYSSKANAASAAIRADNITNNSGAEITSQLTAGAKDLGGVQTDLGLTLDAKNNLSNFGTISSAGDLTVSAGNTLTNTGTVAAVNNVNVLSPSVTNSGTIASVNSNITLDTPVAAAMNFNNANGTVQALNGSINVRGPNYNAAFDSNINGGDYLSKNFNINAGQGTVNVNAGNLTGVVSGDGYGTHVTVDNTDTLQLGSLDFIDPTFYNNTAGLGGSINIAGDITVAEDLTIIARRSITNTGTRTITAANGSQGFNINLIAGMALSGIVGGANQTTLGPIPPANGNNGQVTVGTAGAVGGNVTLNDFTINTRATGAPADSNGGNVLIAARQDGITAGNVTITGASNITTGGTGTGTNGNVVILSGGQIDVVGINTTGGNGVGGNVTVSTANPGGSATYAANGSLAAGGIVGTTTPNQDVNLNGAINAGAGSVLFVAGDDISINSAASIATTSGTISAFAADDINVNGAITSSLGATVGLASAGGGSPTVNLGASVTSTGGTVNIGGEDNILRTAGTVTGSTVNLTSFGGIGAGANRIFTDAATLTANAGGSVFISEANAINIGASTTGNQFNLLSTGAGLMDVTGAIGTNNLVLNSNTALTISAAQNIATAITLTANNAGALTTALAGSLQGGTVSLNAAAGGIVTNGTVAGSTVGLTTTGAGTIVTNNTLAATGPLSVSSNSTLDINGTTSGNLVILGSNGAMTLDGALSSVNSLQALSSSSIATTGTINAGTTLVMNANGSTLNVGNTISAGTSASLLANTNLTTSGAGVVNAPTVSLVSNTGNIGLNPASRFNTNTPALTASATGGSAFINNTGVLALGASTAGATLDVLTTGNLSNTGVLSGLDVTLRSTGGALTVNAPINSGSNLNLRGFGNVTNNAVLNSNNVTLQSDNGSLVINNSVTGNTVNLLSFNSINNSTLGGFVTANNTLNLTSTVGSIGSAGDQLIVLANNLSANAAAGSVYIIDAANVANIGLGASSAAGTFQLTRTNAAAGDIIVVGTLGAANVLLQNVAGDGGVAVTNIISAIGGGDSTSVSLVALGAGAINTNGAAIRTNSLNLQSTSGNIGGGTAINTNAASLTANTTGNVTINDSRATSVTLNTSSGDDFTVNLTTANAGLVVAGQVNGLNSITLSTLGIGNITRTGASSVLTSPTLTLSAGGNIGSNVNALLTDTAFLTASAGVGKNIFISENDDVDLGNIVGNAVTISAVGSITNNSANAITANTVNLSSTVGSIGAAGFGIITNASNLSATALGDVYLFGTNAGTVQIGALSGQVIDLRTSVGNINLLQDVTGTTSVLISSGGPGAGSITQTAGRTILTPTLALVSLGDIGTSGAAIRTSASNISANTLGDAYINGTGSVVLGASQADTFRLVSAGDITLAGALSVNDGTLNTTNNGNIDLQANIVGLAAADAVSVTLNANGTGNISRAGATSIATVALTLTSGSGNIGSNALPILTNASVLKANTTGNVFVSDTNLTGITLNQSSGSNFNLAFSSLLNVAEGITGSTILLNANGTDTGVNLNGNITATTKLTINATGAGTILNPGAVLLSTPSLVLTSGTGDIGALVQPILTDASTISASTLGDIFINNIGTGDLNLGPLTGTDLSLGHGGNINVVGLLNFTGDLTLFTGNSGNINVFFAINADDLTLSTAGLGNLNVSANLTGASSVALNVTGGTLTQANGTLISTPQLTLTSISGSMGSAINPITTNAGILTANSSAGGNIFVRDTTTGDLQLVGANGTAGLFSLVATNSAATQIYTPTLGDFVFGGTADIRSLNGSVGNFVSARQLNANNLNNLVVNAAVNVSAFGITNLNFGGGNSSAGQTFVATSGANITSTSSITGTDVAIANLDGSGGSIALAGAVTATTGTAAIVSSADLNNGDFATVNAENLILGSLDGNVGATGALVLNNTTTPNLLDLAVAADGFVNVAANKSGVLTLRAIGIPFAAPLFSTNNLANGGSYTVTNTGGITVGGAVSATTDVSLTSSAGALSIDSTITGPSSISLSSFASISDGTFGASANLVSPQLNLTSTGASIGSSADRLDLTGGTNVNSPLNLTLNALTDVYVDYAGTSLTLGGGASAAVGTFAVTSTGNLNSSGTVDAAVVDLQAVSVGATMQLDSVITGATSVNLVADGNILNTLGSVNGGALTVTSNNGDIGANADRLNTAVTSVALTALNGSAYVANTGDLSVLASTTLTDLCIDNIGTMTVNGQLNANAFSLDAASLGLLVGDLKINAAIVGTGLASSIVAGADNDITSNATGTIDVESGIFVALNDMNFGANIHSTAAPLSGGFTFTAGGNFTNAVGTLIDGFDITVDATELFLNGNIDTTAFGIGNNVSILSTNTILSGVVAKVATSNLLLDSSDAIGLLADHVVLGSSVQTVSLIATNDAFVDAPGNINLTGASIGGDLAFTTIGGVGNAGGAVTVSGVVTGANVSITANSGDTNTGTLTVGAAVSATNNVTLLADSTVTTNVGGTVAGTTISITSTNAGLSLGDTVVSSGMANSVSLTSNDSLDATTIAQIAGATVSLTSTAGDIGSSGTPVQVNAQNLALNAFGDAYVSQVNNVNLLASTAGNTLSVVIDPLSIVGGNITVSGALTADIVVLTAESGLVNNGDINVNAVITGNDGAASGSVTLTADNDITSTVAGDVVADGNIALAAGNNIGSLIALFETQAPSISVAAGQTNVNGNAFINHTGDVDITAGSAGTAGTFAFGTDSTVGGNILVSGVLTANNVILTANDGLISDGDITLGALSAVTGTNSVILSADGAIIDNAVITSANVVLNAVDGIGSSSLPVEVTNGVSAMTLVVNGGSADAFVNYLGSNTLTLNASNADDFTLNTSTGSIATGADSVFTGTLSITTNSLTNANDLSAAVINIQSNASSGLTLDGGVGGSLTSTGLITVKATDNNLDLFGQMTYNGTANLFANKTGQAIVLNNGSNSIATVSSFLFTSTVTTLGTGTLTGPWNIVNAGTFANSTGDVTLTGSLNFVGADVAIIASGNIDLTGATLSLSGVNGGDLTMLAGYNFLPATAGQVIDVTTSFGTFTPSAGGSILGGANIDTSGTSGNGGSVIAIANNGTINLGTITTTGDATHAGGAVTLIGSNGITVGNIDTTGGSASGPVTLAVASPVVTGLTVQNGSVTAGTITVGAASAGDLSFANITATGATVALTGALTVVSDTMIGSGIIAANTVSLTTGSGVANIGNVNIATLNSAGDGVVSVNETNAISLGTITGSGQQLTVTAGGAITNGSNFTVSILNLTGVAAATNAAINLTGNVTASTSGILTSTGGGDIRGALSTANLTLNSSGNIGVDGTTRFLTDASTLTVDAAGSAFLNVSNNRSTIASLNAGTVTGTLNISKTGDLTTGGVVTAGTAVLNATGNIGTSLASRFLVDTATLTAVAGTGGVFITDSHPTAMTITGTNTAGTAYAVRTAGDLSNGGTITAASVDLSSGGVLNGLGTITSPILSLTQANELDDDIFTGATVNATTLSLRSTAGNIGTSTVDRFVLGNQFTNVSAFSNTGSVFLQSTLNGVTLGGGSAFAGDFDYLGAGTTTVTGNITTTNGDINIVTGINRITVNTGVSLHANGTTAGNGNILLRVLDTTKNARNTSIITVNGTLETDAVASPDGLITVSVGVVTAPAAGKVPKSGVVVSTSLGGQIFWGKKASKFNGINNFIAKGTNIVLNNSLGSKNVTFNSATVDADPPVGPAMNIAINTPTALAAAPAALATDAQGVMQTMFGFDTDDAMVTSDLSVLNLNAAPQVQLANNAALATGNVANFTQATRATSGQARANTTFAQVADDDDSYVVGYAAATGETGAAICSDVEIGVGQGKGIEKVQHGERVVIKKGNVLFVPFKDTTVETPRGNVHIAAKSVALVSISESGLAVYDLEDQHKGSVSVESNGHNIVLSPGRHVLVTAHQKAEFAQVNAIETVAHRNVSSTMKNGVKAHVTEFSIPTALDTIAPLKAMVKSNHPEAKKIADRMMKTTAIILQIGGGAGQYQHYFRPRMTAMGN